MDSDPHVLVALGAGSIGHQLRAGTENPRDGSSPTLSDSHGITDDDDTNIRTFPVLDAIASLSVADASGQVVAVALQVDFSQQRIVLTVAENGPVNREVLAHISHMWLQLSFISNKYDILRRNDPAVSDSTLPPSPPIPVSLGIEPLRTVLIESIYRYSILKTQSRFDRWWVKLARFAILLQGREVSNVSGLRDSFINTVIIISESRQILEKIRTKTHITAHEWKSLIYTMDGIIPNVAALLSDKTQCEEWAKELQGSFSPCSILFPFLI